VLHRGCRRERSEKRLWEGGFRPKGRRTWEASEQTEDRIFTAIRGFLDGVEGPDGVGHVKPLWVYVSDATTRA